MQQFYLILMTWLTELTLDSFIRNIFPLLLSCISIWMTVEAGNFKKRAWLIGLVNQALWLVWILYTENIGFLPMNLFFWYVYMRNHLKWKKDSRTK